MPRITDERRAARRAQIVAAARRCFSRDGFHRTSMPDIAAEAGLSVGASYRYFAGKEEVILEIARQAFGAMFSPVLQLLEEGRPVTVGDLVARAVEPFGGDVVEDAGGDPVPVDELLRCGVQTWAELLRHEPLSRHAAAGVDHVRAQMAAGLRRGQEAGTVRAGLDPERTTRVVMALLHGFLLQRIAFGLDDCAGFVEDVRALLDDGGPGHHLTSTTPEVLQRTRADDDGVPLRRT
jgi:AcrR family transcriptional regulator